MITWQQRVLNLRSRLGREPLTSELFEESKVHTLTPEEIEAQRKSWARGNVSTGDPRFD